MLSLHGPVVLYKQHCAVSGVRGIFFPLRCVDWGLPAEVLLSSRAARRVAREGAVQSFDQAALALNEDWGTHLDGKQIERWSQAIGRAVLLRRDAEVAAYDRGVRPTTAQMPRRCW